MKLQKHKNYSKIINSKLFFRVEEMEKEGKRNSGH